MNLENTLEYSELDFSLEILNVKKNILKNLKIEKGNSNSIYEDKPMIIFYKDADGLIHELSHLIVLRRMKKLREENKDLFDFFSEFYASAISYLLKNEDVLGDPNKLKEDIIYFLRRNSRNFAFSTLGRYVVFKIRDRLEPLFLKDVKTAYKYFLKVLKDIKKEDEIIRSLSSYSF